MNDPSNDEQTPRDPREGTRFDVTKYRNEHSAGNKIGRVIWWFVYHLLFRTSPNMLFRWRRFLLNLFGAKLHPLARVYPTAKIWAPWNLTMDEYATLSFDVDCYSVAPIHIGANSTVSQYSFLCTASHDIDDPGMRLTTAPITIGPSVWICADVFVAPGVTIGEGTVVGSRSSVFQDIPPWSVAAGYPCKVIRSRVKEDVRSIH